MLELVSGSPLVLDAVGFDKRLVGADLVVTGEGRIDGQSIYGKLTHAVTVAAKRRGVPVVAVAGMIGQGHEQMRAAGIEAIETLAGSSDADRDAAMREPLPRIEDAAERTGPRSCSGPPKPVGSARCSARPFLPIELQP